MRSAPFDWRPYLIEFHKQAPKLMKARAFVLGGDLHLRLSADGVTLKSYVCVAPDGEVRGGLCACFGKIGMAGFEPTAEPERMKNAMALIIKSMLAPSRLRRETVMRELAKVVDPRL